MISFIKTAGGLHFGFSVSHWSSRKTSLYLEHFVWACKRKQTDYRAHHRWTQEAFLKKKKDEGNEAQASLKEVKEELPPVGWVVIMLNMNKVFSVLFFAFRNQQWRQQIYSDYYKLFLGKCVLWDFPGDIFLLASTCTSSLGYFYIDYWGEWVPLQLQIWGVTLVFHSNVPNLFTLLS